MPIVFHFADGPKLGNSTYVAATGIPSTERDPDGATLVPMVLDAVGGSEPVTGWRAR